ncbi:PIR protein [Plasmodium ovale]|uniref:PIR Superfamily Protein n=2 Tax=Plasmodium ovale TaxID=36330 RepID=A0A1A8XAC3_PLAOA|nr:PIR Superfamily Protein [Plasmodium ovale curtisi]SBT01576.1 PIR Superfamily Protein [Plasmodium ovale curtisi]SBT83408.1 PIR protein [Plasmodium ovale]
MGSDDENEDEGYIHGDTYYSTVSSFLKYEDEFNRVTESSVLQKHGVNCKQKHNGFFSSNNFIDRCDKVANYLYYINQNKDEDYDNRCRCLNYLINTKTTFKTVPNKKCTELFDAYKEISSELKTCNLIIDCIYEKDLEKITKLHALHNSLNKLEMSIKLNEENINSNAEEFANLYLNCKSYCKGFEKDDYCEELEKITHYCYYHTNSKNCEEIAKLLKYQMKLKKAIKISVPCIIILTIPFFLYILHKFTSIGSWLNNFLIKNKIIQHNMNEEVTDQFFEHIHETEDREKCSSHHIGYHST